MNYPAVEGYGERLPGEVYHPTADFDPAFVFANAGDAKAQAEYQEDLKVLGEAALAEAEEAKAEAEEVPTGEALTTNEQSNASVDTANVEPDVPVVPDNSTPTFE